MKTVLLTGATGFVGRHTIEALYGPDWKIIATTRDPESAGSAPGLEYLDLLKPESIYALADRIRCDAIVHLGAAVGFSGESLAEFYPSNVLSTGCLADLSRIWGSHLVFASSIVVHGLHTRHVTSQTAIQPDSPYGRSKALAEELIAASGTRYCILRIPGVFGLNGPAHLGLNRAICAARQGEIPTCVGTGAACRNYISASDLAAAILHVLDHRIEGIHAVGGPEALSIRTMLEHVCGVWLENAAPLEKQGPEGTDQIVVPSDLLPAGRAFLDSLKNIRNMDSGTFREG